MGQGALTSGTRPTVGHKGRRVSDLEGGNTGPTSPACQTVHGPGPDTHSATLLRGHHGPCLFPRGFGSSGTFHMVSVALEGALARESPWGSARVA